MATAWSQGGQTQPQSSGPHYQPAPPVRRTTNPPPVCFNCGVEGHFLVACPEATRQTPSDCVSANSISDEQYGNSSSAFVPTPAPHRQFSGSAPSAPYQPQPGPPQTQYPPYPPQPDQQYGPPTTGYSYSQQYQQPYNSQPPNQQYGRPPYQAIAYNQYPQASGPPQYIGPGYQGPSHGPPQGPPQQYRPPIPAAAPYQPPQSPFPSQNTGYSASPASYRPSPPQWNTTPQPPQPQYHPPQHQLPQHHLPPHQPPQRINSGQQVQHAQQNLQAQSGQYPQQRAYSTTPSHQSQGQQSQQSGHGAESIQHTPKTPSSNPTASQQNPPQGTHTQISTAHSSNVEQTESEVDRVGTPYGDYGSEDGESFPDQVTKIWESDEEKQKFCVEWKHIFTDPAKVEWVALAQPLAANFKSTPVPLIQAWSVHLPSISRYARKDNVKDFVQPIRELPQWSYLQEDPAFAELKIGDQPIPLDEARRRIQSQREAAGQPDTRMADVELPGSESPSGTSRKRARSETEERIVDEQDDVDNQIILESAGDGKDGPSKSKRAKNEANTDSDNIMREITAAMIPVLGRSGTPCLATDDDAWAPSPGEVATSPMDPTEVLLASLGVSGSPKPVTQASSPPRYVIPPEDQPQASQHDSTSQTPLSGSELPPQQPPPLTQTQQSHGIPTNAYTNGQQQSPQNGAPAQPPYQDRNFKSEQAQPQGPQPQYGPPANAGQGQPQYESSARPQRPPSYGPPLNTGHGQQQYGHENNAQTQPQYAPPANVGRGQGPHYGSAATAGHTQNQYGPSTYPQYGAPSNAQPVSQYGPPATNYGPPNPPVQQQYAQPQNSQYVPAPSFNGPQGPPQYQQPPPVNYGNAQYTPQYGPPANTPYSQMLPVNYQQGPPQGTPQYGAPRQDSFGHGHVPGPYNDGAPQYGPPSNAPYSAGHNPRAQSVDGHISYGQGPPQSIAYPGGQNSQNPGSYTPNGDGPSRQDSGYGSARGSYSNGSGPNEFNNQHGSQNQVQRLHANNQSASFETKTQQTLSNTEYQPPVQLPPQETISKHQQEETRGDESMGSPLSPTSAEILGQPLSPNSAKILGQLESGERKSERKHKRPQPVVAEAYSRRW